MADLDSAPQLREVGHLAVWSVTSAKAGNGVDMLRDSSAETFWQSDGLQPHLVNIQFQKKVAVTELHVYCDFKLDESYTPSKMSIRAGTGYHDLKEVRLVDLEEPCGWTKIPLKPDGSEGIMRTFFLQLAVLANHQNGRDTHVRQVKIFGPRADPYAALGLPCAVATPEFAMYATVR